MKKERTLEEAGAAVVREEGSVWLHGMDAVDGKIFVWKLLVLCLTVRETVVVRMKTSR